MNLKNEAVLVRTLIGAVLGVLVAFGVKLSGGQLESLQNLSDALLALLPTITTLLGAWSARGKVDGPVTAQVKTARIAELEGK